MVQSLEAIKGGGGSIRVGTTGTISSLMTRELDSMKIPSHHQSHNHHNQSSSSSSRRKSLDIEPSSSNSITNTTQQEFGGKKPKGSYSNPKSNKNIKTTQKIQLLGAEENNRTSFDRTPIREKRGPTIVEVVDIRCGTSSEANRAWTVPITSRLRRLGFSKLSDHNDNNVG